MALSANKQRAIFTEIANELRDSGDLWRTPDDDAYATITRNGCLEHVPVASGAFRDYLSREIFLRADGYPTKGCVDDAVEWARCAADGDTHEAHVRLAQHNGELFVDLCDPTRKVVQIGADGWRVVSDAPVKFVRSGQRRALPIPQSGGDIELLRPFLNFTSEDQFELFVGWVLSTYMPRGPYPLLMLSGGAGSGKSTMIDVAVRLTDPSTSMRAGPPNSLRDLAVRAKNNRVLSFDNLSHIQPWLSDELCRIATGGGWSHRKLYKDDDEVSFMYQRPIVFNGIGNLTARQDLADRTIKLDLTTIENIMSERHFWDEFEDVWPKVMGVLFDAVVVSLGTKRTQSTVPGMSRIKDAIEWIESAEGVFGWAPRSFRAAYERRQEEMFDEQAELDIIVITLHNMLKDVGWEFEGSYYTLLDKMSMYKPRWIENSFWPNSPRGLSGALQRSETLLRRAQISVERLNNREAGSGRHIVRVKRVFPKYEEKEDGVCSM